MIRNLCVSLIALGSIGCMSFDANEKNECYADADCVDGRRCDSSTHTCQSPGSGGQCERKTECSVDECGMLPDGCGAYVNCGECSGGTWTSIDFTGSSLRRDTASVVMPGGAIYVIGGRGWSDTLRKWALVGTDLVEAYDPDANTWTTRAPMPTARFGHTAVPGTDGWIYVIGGRANTYDYATAIAASVVVERYNPASDTWETAPSLPAGRFLAAAVAGSDGRIHVTGGYGSEDDNLLDTVATFAPGDAEWTTLPERMSMPRAQHVAVAVPDGRTIVIGGVTEDTSTGPAVIVDTQTVEAFWPGMPWYALPNVGWKHTSAAAAVLDNVVYVVAGLYSEQVNNPYIEYHSRVSAFDLAADTWETAPYLLADGKNTVQLVGHTAAAHDGHLYVIGGHMTKDYLYDYGEKPVGDTFVYTPPP